MQLIKKIRIKRFRSFSEEIIEATRLNIYSGRNNSGKSNILRALNLFFNNKSNYDAEYEHSADYNMAFRGAAGGPRQIQIEITFNPIGEGALQYEFSVMKTYNAETKTPGIEYKSTNTTIQEKLNKRDGNVIRQFTRFLNKIEYLYVPAVRDRKFIKSLLLSFEQIMKSEARSDDFDEQISTLSDILKGASAGISRDFEKYIGLPANASLSSKATDVLGAIEIFVHPGMQILIKGSSHQNIKERLRNVSVSLFSSGDGVVMAYLVYFLAYLTKRNRGKNFIWGFEEPENSLEYAKVQHLAEEFYEKFSNEAQIFVTTHSPAFISLKDRQEVSFYRVYVRPLSIKEKQSNMPDRKITHVQSLSKIKEAQLSLFNNDADVYKALDDELHLVDQSIEIEKMAKEVEEEKNDLRLERKRLDKEIEELSRSRPDKIFICEDNRMVGFWKKVLREMGIEEVSVISSEGCTGLRIEDWAIVQAGQFSNYHPRIFREVDRDGLSDGMINDLEEAMERKVNNVNGIVYKFSHLPVCEIENFAILMSKEPFDDCFYQNIRMPICDALSKTVEARLGGLRKIAYIINKDPSDYNYTADTVCCLRDEAEKEWQKKMPGKDILKKIKNNKLFGKLKNSKKEEWPKEMKEYAEKIKDFFK